MTHVTENDIERILKTKSADYGLFILAMHSLMERALREKYNSTSSFGNLIDKYTYEYKLTYGTPIYQGSDTYNFPKDKHNIYRGLQKIYKNHYLSNDVRHQFAEFFDEDAKTTVYAFWHLLRWKGGPILKQ